MNISRHAKYRYIERIKGVVGTNEIKQYMVENTLKVERDIETMFEFAEKIYRGQIGGDKTTKDFYIHQDICFVVADDQTIVTIYKIDFEFPVDMKDLLIKRLKEEIVGLSEKFKDDKEQIDREIEELKDSKEDNNRLIKELEEQIAYMKQANKMIDEQIDHKFNGLKFINYDINKYAKQLFGNNCYKEDYKKGFKED